VIGKNNLDRPALIFKDLGIPTYLIFDTDSNCKPTDLDSNKKINTILKEIMGESGLSDPFEKQIENNYASLNPNMTILIRFRT